MTGWEDYYREPEAATRPERAVPTEPQPALPGMPAGAVRPPPAQPPGDPYGTWMTTGPSRSAGPGAHAKTRAGRGWALLALAVSALALAASALAYLSPPRPPPPRAPAARPASVCVHVDRRTGFVKALTRPPCTGSSRVFRIP